MQLEKARVAAVKRFWRRVGRDEKACGIYGDEREDVSARLWRTGLGNKAGGRLYQVLWAQGVGD
jgi:hypothetical protein